MLESFLTKAFQKKNRKIIYKGHEVKPEEAASLNGGAILLLMLAYKTIKLMSGNNEWIENMITICPDDSNPNLFIDGIRLETRQTDTQSIYPLLSLLQTSIEELCLMSDDPNLIDLNDINRFVSQKQGVLHELNIDRQTFQEASEKITEQQNNDIQQPTR